MKLLFWFAVIGLILFEIANVYFIMPMTGSQRMNSIDLAYFLYKWRWMFRAMFALLIIAGLFKATWKRKWVAAIPLILLAAVIYMANFKMAADAMFQQPKQILFKHAADNKVDSNRLIIGIEINGEAKAYPVQYMGYHHHLQDTVGGKPILVTYCTVCRTGRVFEPMVNGKHEQFRLVGMDHFNAMLEDKATKSWWRQATGEAIAGELKGFKLTELLSKQTSLDKWIELHPQTSILQADPSFTKHYDTSYNYESGKSKSKLTGTDSISWNDKSWVVGIRIGNKAKAYDWNRLKKERIIHDTFNRTAVLLLLAKDDKSFFAFERSSYNDLFLLSNDTVSLGNNHFRVNGTGIDTTLNLKPIIAYQEFWHSWRTFQPQTFK
jgi:Protein of unknown function (DUF3179)